MILSEYQWIEKAISAIGTNDDQRQNPTLWDTPSWLEIEALENLFLSWCGVSYATFVCYISKTYRTQALLRTQRILDLKTVAQRDVFSECPLQIEVMTEEESFGILIEYEFGTTRFGKVLIASSAKGICFLSFVDCDEETSIDELKATFKEGVVSYQQKKVHQAVFQYLNDFVTPKGISLHVKGTPFQLKIWQNVMQLPFGGLTTYGNLAKFAGIERASRAVATAIGKNNIAILIPCHRIILSTGLMGDYRWGSSRKKCINGLEAIIKKQRECA